jgi:hypothetical protein
MPIFATAGAKVFIGTALDIKEADFEVTDFTDVTWTEIQKLESMGSLGGMAEALDVTSHGYKQRQRMKGLRSEQTMELIAFIDYTDPGQLALIAAEKTDDHYAFKVTFDDAPTDGTPSERYFVALVGGLLEVYDTVDTVMKLNSSLWVNSNIVRVDAAEAGV